MTGVTINTRVAPLNWIIIVTGDRTGSGPSVVISRRIQRIYRLVKGPIEFVSDISGPYRLDRRDLPELGFRIVQSRFECHIGLTIDMGRCVCINGRYGITIYGRPAVYVTAAADHIQCIGDLGNRAVMTGLAADR